MLTGSRGNVQCAMTNENEQRRNERVISRDTSVVPRPPYIYTPRRAHKPYSRMCRKDLRKLAEWTESDHAPERKRGVQASRRSRGTCATRPLAWSWSGLLGPVDPRERRWATADEAGDLIRRAGCRSPKDEGRLLPAALRRASRLPELYCELCCELGRGRVLATSRPRRALPPPSQRAGPHGAQAMSCGGGR